MPKKIESPISKMDLEQLYHAENLSFTDIAARFGVSRSLVGHWFRDAGIPVRSKAVGRHQALSGRLLQSPFTQEELRDLYDVQKLSGAEVRKIAAARLGKNTVQIKDTVFKRWLSEADISPRTLHQSYIVRDSPVVAEASVFEKGSSIGLRSIPIPKTQVYLVQENGEKRLENRD